MGKRGPQPTLTTAPAPGLTNLDPPDWLGEHGRDHWTAHARRLADTGLLTTATAHGFALCCDLWDRVRQLAGGPTSKTYHDTVSKYQSYAKHYHLLPIDKPVQPASRHQDKKVFNDGF